MQKVLGSRDEKGDWTYQTNSYVQLETGLNYQDDTGNWTPSSEEIEVTKEGAIARRGQHTVSFSGNLNTEGAIKLTQPDGKVLTSHVYGLAYLDSASGKCVLIAEVKNSQGWILGSNQVVYTDAFADVMADVRYTYTKAGFEQDIILRSRPPNPEKYGLDPSTTRLEVWTEFIDSPEPTRVAKVLTPDTLDPAQHLVDEDLDFRSMQIGTGRTFKLGDEESSLAIVAKQWIPVETRRFLVETVAVEEVKNAIDSLPPADGKSGASFSKPSPSRLQALRALKTRSRLTNGERELAAKAMPSDRMVAFNAQPGLVLDYVILSSGNNVTFSHNLTYYVTGPVNLTGTTTFDGGTVIKYANTGNPTINISGAIVWRGEMYRPVVMTAKDDNTVGEPIVGSSGTPANYYASRALNITGNSTTTMSLAHFRIAHAQTAIGANNFTGAAFPLVLRHGQVVNCRTAFTFGYGTGAAPTYKLQNILVYNSTNVFENLSNSAGVQGDNLTINSAVALNYNPGSSTLALNNSLLTGIVNSTGSFNTATTVLGSSAGVYSSFGGGNHYLAADTYRNSASASIDTSLAAELRRMTTYAPRALVSNFIEANTTISPQVILDTDILDRGYHYPPLDYIPTSLQVTGGKLSLKDGVAIGYSDSFAIWLKSGTALSSVGTPARMNVLVRYTSVQEAPISGAPGHNQGGVTITAAGSTVSPPTVVCRFTSLYADQGDYHLYVDSTTSGAFPMQSVSLTDCQIYGGRCTFSCQDLQILPVVLRNNFWFQNYLNSEFNVTILAFNQLWKQSTYSMVAGVNGSEIRNSVFDNSTVDVLATTIVNSHNGYAPLAATKLPGTLGADVTSAAFSYSNPSGGFGAWYQSGSTLVDKGSHTAAVAGLSQHTTLPAQTKDTGLVDIGFHYVTANTATRQAGDGDSDGIADYMEDRDGDAVLDIGETDVGLADTDRDGRTDYEEATDGTNPRDASVAKPTMLARWFFDNPNNWNASGGQIPLVNSFGGNAAALTANGFSGQVSSFVLGLNPATQLTNRLLTYKWAEGNSKPNLTFGHGSVRFWFRPNWSSLAQGGTGPGAEARMVNIGTPVLTTSGNGWWAVYVESNGNQLTVGTQAPASATQVKLSADISWKINSWHFIEISYSAQQTLIYLDGKLVKVGAPPAAPPNSSALIQGIAVGSDTTGLLSAKGFVDRLETYNYPQAESESWAEYQAVTRVDQDTDGLSDVVENEIASDPLNADSDLDTMKDGWEVEYGFNPLDPADKLTDADGDLVPNHLEHSNGTDPRDNDAAVRASVPLVTDTFQKALDQKHLINIDLGAVKTTLVQGPKAAGFGSSDWWNQVNEGESAYIPTAPVPDLLREIKLNYADSSPSKVRIWSGFGPCFEGSYWGVRDGAIVWVTRWGNEHALAIPQSCVAGDKSIKEQLECLQAAGTKSYSDAANIYMFRWQNIYMDEGHQFLRWWPGFEDLEDWKNGVGDGGEGVNGDGLFLPGLNDLLPSDPAANTVDDVLTAYVPPGKVVDLDMSKASTRTVISGLEANKPYRLYVKGTFSGIQTSQDDQVISPSGSGSRFIGEVAGGRRYIVKPQAGAVTINNSRQLAWIQLVELEPLPAPVITTQMVSYSAVRLQWNQVPTAEVYRIFRREGATGEFLFVSSTAALGFVDGSLKSGTAYTYYVLAANEELESPRSSSVTLTTRGTDPYRHNKAPVLYRPEPIQFAEQSQTFKLSVPLLQAATGAFDPEGQPISFRIDSVPPGQTLKRNGVPVPATGAVQLNTGDVLEWSAPNQSSEDGIVAFYLSATDGLVSSLNSVAIPIVVRAPSVVYGWGYAGGGNIAQGSGTRGINVDLDFSVVSDGTGPYYRQQGLVYGLPIDLIEPIIGEVDLGSLAEKSESNRQDGHLSHFSWEPVALVGSSGATKGPIQKVRKIAPGLTATKSQWSTGQFMRVGPAFGMANALVHSDGKMSVWGLDYGHGLFGPSVMDFREDANWMPLDDRGEFRKVPNRVYVYDSALPLKVSSPGGLIDWNQVSDVSLGERHALALSNSGQVFSWGADGGNMGSAGLRQSAGVSGALGIHSGNVDYWVGFDRFGANHEPLPVAGMDRATAVLADRHASFALLADGSVWYWGSLGPYYTGSDWKMEKDINPSTIPIDVTRPRRLKFSGVSGVDPRIVQMTGAGGHYGFLDASGNVWEFGYIPRLRIASAQRFPSIAHYRFDAAEKTPGIAGARKLSCGTEYSLALMRDGSLYAWGALFESDHAIRRSVSSNPRLISGLPKIRDISVSPGGHWMLPGLTDVTGYGERIGSLELTHYALASDEDGQVWAWGSNAYGALGNQDRTLLTDEPRLVLGISDVSSVTAGDVTAFAVSQFVQTMPVGLKVIPGSQEISLTWSKFFNAIDYLVERSTDGADTGFTQVGVALRNKFTDRGVLNGQSYYYRVKARENRGSSIETTPPSAVVSARPSAPPAVPPGNVFVIAQCKAIEVRWDSMDGAASFRVYRSSGSSTDLTLLGEVDAKINYLVDKGVATGTSYRYTVVAVNSGGVGPASPPTAAVPCNNLLCPPAPSGLAATTPGAESIRLSWSDPYVAGWSPPGSAVATLYKLVIKQRFKDSKGIRFTRVAEVGPGTGTFDHVGVYAGYPKYYTVSALVRITGDGPAYLVESDDAAPVEAVAHGGVIPGVISGLTGQGIKVQPQSEAAKVAAFLSWNDDPNATHYEVQRTVGPGDYVGAPTVRHGDHRFLDTTVTMGLTYYYRVRAVGASFGNWSSEQVVTAPTAGQVAVAVPRMVLAATAYDSRVLLKWPPQGLPAIQYPSGITFMLHRVNDPASLSRIYRPLSVDPPSYGLSFLDEEALNGTTHYYQVLAFDSSQALLNWSSFANATPSGSGAAWNLVATAGNGHVRLSWNVLGASGYRVRYATEIGGRYVDVARTSENVYYHTGLQNGQTYYYSITATVDGAGDVQTSGEVSATPLGSLAPLPPKDVSITFSRSVNDPGNKVWSAVSWRAVDGAAKYGVERGLTAAGSTTPPSTWLSLGETSETFRREEVLIGTFSGFKVWYRIRSIGPVPNPSNSHISNWTAPIPQRGDFEAPGDSTIGLVTLVSPLVPVNGLTVLTPTNLVLRASTTMAGVIRVEFYDDDTLVGVAEEEPWQVTYYNVPSGVRTFKAYAVDSGFKGEYSAPVTVTVKWTSPLNDYQMSASDLTIPATGFPLSLERSYDSGRVAEPGAERGVLGRGWQASWDRSKLTVGNGGDLGSGWKPGAMNNAVRAITESVPHPITVTLLDGSEVVFMARLKVGPGARSPAVGDPIQSPITSIFFDPTEEGTGFLTGGEMDGLGMASSNPNYAFGEDWPNAGDLTLYLKDSPAASAGVEDRYYRPSDFTYVSGDGTTYFFNTPTESGGQWTWRLSSVTDRNGHSLVYSYDTQGRVKMIDHDSDLSSRDLVFEYPAGPSDTATVLVYDPIEWLKPEIERRATVKYFVSLNGAERKYLREVHRLTRRRISGSVDERYEVVRYSYGTGAHELNRLTKVEAGIKQYGPNSEVVDVSGMTWLQVLLNTYSNLNPSDPDPAIYGRLSSQTDANGSVSSLVVTGSNGPTPQLTVTSLVGGANINDTVKGNASGEIVEIIPSGASKTTTFTYNEKGQLKTETLDDKVKTYHYDGRDRLSGVTGETGKGEFTTFNLDGSVSSTEDPNGNLNVFTYDSRGNLERSFDSSGVVTVRTYFTSPGEKRWFGLVQRESREVPGLEHPLVIDYEYTAEGDLLREVQYIDQVAAPAIGASGASYNYAETEYSYDKNGNRLTEKRRRMVYGNANPVFATTSYSYDAQNRVVTTRDPLYASGTLRESLTTYDVYGRTAQTRDLMGNMTEMYYDPNGNLIQTIYPDGTVTRAVYDERNRPRYSQDRIVPANLADCRLPGVSTSTSGPGTENLYDAAGRTVGTRRLATVTIEKAPFGASLTFIAKTTLTSASGIPYCTTRTVYDDAGRVKYSVDVNGAVTESQYDDAGRRTNTLAYTSYQAPFDNFTTPLTPTGNTLVTTSGYDANGNQLWVLDAKGQVLVGANGPDTAEHQKFRTDFRYDAGNRRILTYSPLVEGDTTRKFRQTLYDSLGRRSIEFDEAGVATAFGYDNLGRLTSVTNDFQLVVPSGITLPVTRYAYDEVGNQTKQTDALGRETRFEYDALGRRTKRILPAVAAAANTYHLDESVAYTDVLSGSTYVEQRQVTAFNGRQLTFKHDKMGRLSQKTLALPASPAPPAAPTSWTTEATLDFTYAPQGWLSKVSETRAGAAARYTFFAYDVYGRLTKKDSPEGVLTYVYLPTGSVETIKGYPRSVVAQPANPATATDALALPTSPTPVPDVSVKYEYDRLGRLERVSDLNGTDEASTTIHTAKTLYAYDANGNLDSVRYPDNGGERVEHKYTYTAQNRLKQLNLQRVNSTTGTPSTRIFSFLYHLNANGQRAAVVEDNDPVNAGAPRAVQYVYDTDDADNTPSETPDLEPRARLNRLSQELVTTYDESTSIFGEVDGNQPYFLHRYDLVGNRTYAKQAPSPTVPGTVATLQPSYDNRDRLDSDSTPGNANATYDANGNTLVLKGLTLGVASYDESPNNAAGNVPAGDTYDSENRLVKRVVREAYDANNWKQTTLVLTYDDAGNRVSKVKTVENRLKVSPYTASGTITTTTTYLVDELNPTRYAQVLAEYQKVGAGSLTLQRAYAYGLDLISQRIGGGTTRDYYGYDGHGSVRRLLTVSGTRVLGTGTLPDYTYDAYGRLLTTTDTGSPARNLYRYAGEQWEPDLGLSYNRARYLSPNTGRFWSMDAYEGSQEDPASLHKYLYANADPQNRIDPTGHWSSVRQYWGYAVEDAIQDFYEDDNPGPKPILKSKRVFRKDNPARWLFPDVYDPNSNLWLEVKPLSVRGVASGEAKRRLNTVALAGGPDFMWVSPLLVTIATGETFVTVNIGGVVYYQNEKLVENELILAISSGLAYSAKDLLQHVSKRAASIAVQAGVRGVLARIPVMAAQARAADASRLHFQTGIASLLGALGGL